MKRIIDPRRGDVENEASSPKRIAATGAHTRRNLRIYDCPRCGAEATGAVSDVAVVPISLHGQGAEES